MSELENRLIEAALAAGAAKATLIPQRQIVLSAEFRKICESNACGNYGRCWMCPPDTGDIETAMAQVRQYPWGLLYQTVGEIEDSFDIEGMADRAREHARVSQRVQQAVEPLLQKPFLHLSCGGCRLCETCARCGGEPCRHPDKALTSLEAAAWTCTTPPRIRPSSTSTARTPSPSSGWFCGKLKGCRCSPCVRGCLPDDFL